MGNCYYTLYIYETQYGRKEKKIDIDFKIKLFFTLDKEWLFYKACNYVIMSERLLHKGPSKYYYDLMIEISQYIDVYKALQRFGSWHEIYPMLTSQDNKLIDIAIRYMKEDYPTLFILITSGVGSQNEQLIEYCILNSVTFVDYSEIKISNNIVKKFETLLILPPEIVDMIKNYIFNEMTSVHNGLLMYEKIIL